MEMNAERTLHNIKDLLLRNSAIGYYDTKRLAAIKGCEQRKENYEEYMKSVYGVSNLAHSEGNFLNQCMREHNEMTEIISGFFDCGSVFILDKEKNIVLFLYKVEEHNHKCYVHFNPLDVDLIEVSYPTKRFFENVLSDKIELSKDEELICGELLLLIESAI